MVQICAYYLDEPVLLLSNTKDREHNDVKPGWTWVRWTDGREFIHYRLQLTTTPYGR